MLPSYNFVSHALFDPFYEFASSLSSYVSSFPMFKKSELTEWVEDDDSSSRKKVTDAVVKAFAKIIFHKDLLPIVVDYLEKGPIFGEEEWNSLCGRVAPAPPLPLEFPVIWNGPCPIYPGKKVCETHRLVYLPAKVDDKPLTIRSFGEYAKRYYPKTSERGGYFFPIAGASVTDKPIDKAGWVLMTKSVLPGSRNRTYEQQEKMVSSLVSKEQPVYEIPETIEAVVCILTHYFTSRKTKGIFKEHNYTRCRDVIPVPGAKMVVGCCGTHVEVSKGLCFHPTDPDDKSGVAALRKL